MVVPKKCFWVVLLFGLLSAFNAEARFLGYEYTDTSGELRQAPPDAEYINPVGPIRLLVEGIAGFTATARKSPEGYTAMADISTGQIEFDGQTYYGVKLELEHPASYTGWSNGNSTFTIEVKDPAWNVVEHVETTTYIDTVAGTLYPIYCTSSFICIPQDHENLRGTGDIYFAADVRDMSKGAYVSYKIESPKSGVTDEGKLGGGIGSSFDSSKKIDTGSATWPEREGEYKITFKYQDPANNTDEKVWNSQFDAVTQEFSVVGVECSSCENETSWSGITELADYAAYTPGMASDADMASVLLKVKKGDYYDYNKYGLKTFRLTYNNESQKDGTTPAFGEPSAVYEGVGTDSDYVYLIVEGTGAFLAEGANEYLVEGADHAGNEFEQTVEIAVENGAVTRILPETAVFTFTDGHMASPYNQGNKTWYFAADTTRSSTKAQVRLESDTSHDASIEYEVNGEIIATGTIAKGSRSTTLTYESVFRPGVFKICHYPGVLTSCVYQGTYFYSSLPRGGAPELDRWAYDDSTKRLRVRITRAHYLEAATLHIRRKGDGTPFNSYAPVASDSDDFYKSYEFLLDDLAQDAYEFRVVTVDEKYGETIPYIWENLDLVPEDQIAPTVSLRYGNLSLLGQTLRAINQIRVVVDDNLPGVELRSIVIEGGNSNEVVEASGTRINDSTFAVEASNLSESANADDYSITVVAADAVGNTGEASAAFTFDPVRPVVSLNYGTKPLSGSAITSGEDVRIRVTDNFAGAEIQSAKLTKPDGTTVDASWSRLDSKNFRLTGPSLPASQNAGDYTLTVESVDAAGNTSQASAAFTVDAIEPEVSMLIDGKALAGAATNGGTAIEIRVSDNLAGAEIRSASFSGGADDRTTDADLTRINSTTFRTYPPHPAGTSDYTLTVVAEDAAGNTVEAEASFIVDAHAPSVNVTSAGEALFDTVVAPGQTIEVEITDDRPGVSITGAALITPDGKGSNLTWSRVSEGIYEVRVPADAESGSGYTFEARGVDAVGNTGMASTMFIIDATPVEVMLEVDGEPLAGAAIAPTQKIGVRVVDNMPGAKIQSARLTGPDGTTFDADWTRIDDATYQIDAPIAAGSGEYELEVVGIDAAGTTARASAQFVVDAHAPDVSFRADSDALDSASISKPDDIRIIVSDNFPGTGLQNVTITGGPNGETVEATVSRVNDTTFRVDGPMLYASGSNGDYTITATGVDAVGNTSEASASFSYAPPAGSVAQNANGGVLSIPAARHAFGDIQSEPFVLSDGSTLSGTHAITATLRSISTVSVEVNGVALAPGQTKRVAAAFDFSQSNGRLVLPVAARSTTAEGSAKLLLNVEARGVGQLDASVEVWRANVVLEADKWQVKQGFEPVTINAVVDSATRCRLTRDEPLARAQDALLDPICYLEWDVLPPGLEPASVAEPKGNAIGVRGHATQLGAQDLEYSLWIYDRAGDPFLMQQRQFKLEVVAPYDMGDFALAPREALGSVYRQVETINIVLEQSKGEQCLVTLNAAEAKRRTEMGRLSCLVEYTNVPEGLAQVEWADTPNITGVLDNGGENILSWNLFVFTPQGVKIKVNEQSLSIQADDPPLPELAMDDKERITDGLYAAPMGGGYLGDIKATSYSADLRVSLSRDGEVYETVTVPGGWGDQNLVQRRVNADVRALWSQTPYSAKAQYAELPTYKAEMPFKVLAVPSEQIAPEVVVEKDEVLNTKPLGVTVRMNDPYADGGYDRDTMGRWKVRLVKMEGLESEALTDYVTVPSSGEASFTIDLIDIESERMRLSAEAQLLSPVSAYERTVLSPRPVFLTILRGKPIGATVEGRRLSGLAPLTGVMSLDLNDRLDYSALGDVEWEISTDKSSWSALPGDALYATRLVHVFERGTYWVRANVTNANSGAKLRTPMVRVNAYLVPDIDVEGPENAFIGSTGRYSVAARSPQGDLVYEWSIDGGDSWQSGTDAFEVTRDEETRVPVWVRARYETAPGEDAEAWDTARTRLSFREPRGPRVRISGKSLIETGRPADYQAMVRAPYRNMDIEIGGKWTLPDGTAIDGPEMTYTATRDDLLAERIKVRYEAWIEGYEDQGATDSAEKTLRIWQYQWPEFRIHSRTSADYVPAEIVARLRSMTSTRIRELEDPVIEWEIPAGLTVTEQGTDAVRVLTVAEPGEYTLRAHIEDARGHSATVEETLVFDWPPEFAFELTYSASNRYNRAPMEVRVRPNVSGGHPRDRIQRYIYKLNDVPVNTSGRYGFMDILESGSHEVDVTIETEMGKTATGVLKIEANENVEPSCEIESLGGGSYWRLNANCDDPDGRMASYEWYINGDRVGLSGYRITVRNDGNGPPRVRMIGIDDGGARAPEAIWTGS